jgi:hypothetical protein
MGYVLFLVLLINYLVVYDPELRHAHARQRLPLGEPGFKPNPIDANLLCWARGILRRIVGLAPKSWSTFITSLDFSAAMSKVNAERESRPVVHQPNQVHRAFSTSVMFRSSLGWPSWSAALWSWTAAYHRTTGRSWCIWPGFRR